MAEEEDLVELAPNDIQHGREAITRLLPLLPKARTGRAQGISLRKAAVAMLALARLVRDRGWRDRFEGLPAPEWSITHLDQLEERALALHVLLMDLATAEAGSPGPKVPVELVRRAQRLREKLLGQLEFVLADDEDAMKELASIRRGSGYSDLQSDLVRIAVLYRDHAATLAEELPRRFKATAAADAEQLAADILAAITHGLPPAVQALRLQADQLFGLIELDHDQVVRAGSFLFWGQPDQAHFISARAAAR